MPIDGKLLEILCCPVSKTPLLRLPPEKLEKLNKAVSKGAALYVDGEPVKDAIPEGLITEDGKVIYAIRGGIPVLLAEEGIGTAQFQDF